MVRIGNTSLGNLAITRQSLRLSAVHQSDPRTRCAYGDTERRRNRRNAYERAAFIRYIRELEPKMEHRTRDCEKNHTGYYATRRSNRGASTASAIPGGSSPPKLAKTKRKLVHGYSVLQSDITAGEHVRTGIH